MESQYAEEIKAIKDKLPHGSYRIIAQMIGGKYKQNTVSAMFCGVRTMKPVVLETAKKLLTTIKPEH